MTHSLSLPSIFPRVFDSSPDGDIISLHCALFSIEYACAMSWLESGLEVAAMVGHSFGELVAACVAGSFSLRDGKRFVSARARLIRDNWGSDPGAML